MVKPVARDTEVQHPHLPPGVQRAWFAWLAMQETKHNHFSKLQELEQRSKETGESPSLAEKLHLQSLLDAHDAKVNEFAEEMKQVKDPTDRNALLCALGATLNTTNTVT